MTAYGWNFEFRVSPKPNNRSGRYKSGAAVIPIGAPVAVAAGATRDDNGRLAFGLAAAGTTVPRPGTHGIAVYEHAFEAFEGRDPLLTTTTDLGDVPAATPCQLVNGTDVVVVLRNTVARKLLGRSYTGRVMVAGMGATPTVAVGDLLVPGTGTDTAGYWAEATGGQAPWLVVIAINTVRAEVEARLLF